MRGCRDLTVCRRRCCGNIRPDGRYRPNGSSEVGVLFGKKSGDPLIGFVNPRDTRAVVGSVDVEMVVPISSRYPIRVIRSETKDIYHASYDTTVPSGERMCCFPLPQGG